MYRVIEDKIVVEGIEHITYGIYYNDTFYVKNISTDKEAVIRLTSLCNMGRLDPIQLDDVVEDFLAGI